MVEPDKSKPKRWRHVLSRIGLALGALILLLILALLPSRPMPRLSYEHATPKPVKAYVEARLEASKAEGVLRGNEERLVERSPEKTRVAILYIHGFGAARAEGEAVTDVLAEELQANVYYTRLPGHGGGMEAQAAATYEQYFERVEEAFHEARLLGEKVLLVGSSTGGLLCVWLASRHPEDVSALVLASPLFAIDDPSSVLLTKRLGMPLIELLLGKERDSSWRGRDPEKRKVDGYDDHWITRQYYRALTNLDDIRRVAARQEVMQDVKAPMLLMYYEADEKRRDHVVSIPAMHQFFAMANGGKPHPLSRELAIADGSHVLLSAYVRTDKEKILAETRKFLAEALK